MENEIELEAKLGFSRVCPDFTALLPIAVILRESLIKIGAQNAALKNCGALTGEVSVLNLKELGVKYVIIGHSERREIMGESDELINEKMKTVVAAKNLTPILCIGEKHHGQNPVAIFEKQLTADLAGVKISPTQKIIVAYEPLWAIGTGKVITAKEVLRAQVAIKEILEKLYAPALVKNNFSIIYGGSVDEKNAKNFADLANVDGLLVGGASLTASKFIKICLALL